MANVKNIKKIVTNNCKRPVSPIRIKKQRLFNCQTVSHHINDVEYNKYTWQCLMSVKIVQ